MVADQEPGGSQDCSILSVGQHQRLIRGINCDIGTCSEGVSPLEKAENQGFPPSPAPTAE